MEVKNNIFTKIRNKYYEKQADRNTGFNRGQMVYSAATIPTSVASIGAIAAMRKASVISKADSVELSKAVQQGLKDSNLAEKGVKVFKMQEIALPKQAKDFVNLFTKDNFSKKDKKALKALAEEMRNNPLMKKLLGNNQNVDLSESVKKGANAIQFKFGLNAGYLPKANKIITPSHHLQTSVFHEMGHALNANGNKLLKGLQKVRPLALIAPAIILTASLLNKRKTTDTPKENDNAIQKGADFVKKNAAGLTALSMLPIVLEEGIATLRGQGIAKNLVKNGNLSKEILKKVKLTNLGGFASYALTLVGTALAVKTAITVKDKIQAKHEAKYAEKLNKANNNK